MNKNLRATLCLLLCFATVLSFAACRQEEAIEPTGEKTTYTVQVVNEAGTGIADVGVYVYEDSTKAELVWYQATDANGQISFTDVQRSTYVAVLEGVPTGYAVEEYYALTDLATVITLSAGTMTGEEEITFQLGDMMMDFAFTATDGMEYTFKGLLKHKQAVVLNFYYNGCQPCRMEFPYLQEAYEEYAHQVAVVAMNPVDDAEAVAAFQKELELSFLMTSVNENWQNIMGITAYPTTVVIDRFGNIVLMHTGSIDSAQMFRDIFNAVASDEYEQKIYQNISEIETAAPVGSAENPDFMGATPKFDITIPARGEYHIEFLKLNNLTMQVKDPDTYVIYQGQKYTPKNGVISLLVDCPDMNTSVIIVFGNNSDAEKTVTVTMTAQPGSLDNPFTLKEGETTVKIAAGNEQGVYYIWTAPENGTLRAWCTAATAGVGYDCTLYNLISYAQRSLSNEGLVDEEGNKCVEVKVNKGDRVQMIAAVIPDESWNYPGGSFTYQVKFIEGEGRDSDKVEKTEYVITVVDEEEKPVSNVKFQIVTEEETHVFASDETGVAQITLPVGTYVATMIVPDGYEAEVTEFELTEEAPTCTAQLKEKVIVMVDYTVTVVDMQDAPIANVTVIIGDKFANTDEQGKALFSLEQGQYTVQVSAPEGYVALDGYDFAQDATEITVTLDYTPGTQHNPIGISELITVTDPLSAGSGRYYNLFNMSGLVLMVADADAKITVGETQYVAQEGVLSFVVPSSGGVMQPVTMYLENGGVDAKSFTITITYPLGHRMNPQALTALGQLETHLNSQYEDGYFYTWTAAEEGVVTFYVSAATDGAVYDISLTNTTNSANRTLQEDGESGFVSLNVAAGDLVSIQILPLNQYEAYPNADITAVGSFRAQENTEDAKLTYSVIVTDGAGYPMPGVAVTIGTAELVTDENGMCFVQLVEGSYTATIIPPEDYFLTNNQLTLTPEMPQAEVMLDAIIFVDYQVNLLYNGSAYTGEAKVQFLQGSIVIEEQVVTTGVASISLPLDDYTVKLMLSDGQLGYDAAAAVLTPGAPVLNITLNRLVTNTDYTVTVLDTAEKPVSGIMVQILEGTKTVAAVVTDANGVAAKSLPTGNYTVKLTFSDTSYYYNTQTAVLTGVAPNLVIRLANEVDTSKYDVHWMVNDEKIYMLSEGVTHVQLGTGKPYTYIPGNSYTDCLFIFAPKQLGVYSIGVDVTGLEIRSYGQYIGNVIDKASDFEDGTLHYEIKNKSQLGNVYLLFGVENREGITDVCITITRIGEPGFSMEDLPVKNDWFSGKTPVAQSTPAGTMQYIDIKAASGTYEVFYDEADQVYKVMVDGQPKTLYFNMGTVTTQNISLNLVVNGDGTYGGSPLRKYFYDDKGNMIYKEEYTDIVKAFVDCADPNHGLYPLTKDLAYIILNAKPGWWNVTHPDYILTDCNPDYGWLFAACYFK